MKLNEWRSNYFFCGCRRRLKGVCGGGAIKVYEKDRSAMFTVPMHLHQKLICIISRVLLTALMLYVLKSHNILIVKFKYFFYFTNLLGDCIKLFFFQRKCVHKCHAPFLSISHTSTTHAPWFFAADHLLY